MNGWLFNAYGKILQVRDWLTAAGPKTLRSGADALALLEQAFRQGADLVDQFGVGQVVPPGAGASFAGGFDDELSKKYITELQEVYHQAGAEMSRLSAPEARGPFTNWIGQIDPATKKMIWGLLQSVVTQVLLKGGIAIAGAGPAAGQAKQPAQDKAQKQEK